MNYLQTCGIANRKQNEFIPFASVQKQGMQWRYIVISINVFRVIQLVS